MLLFEQLDRASPDLAPTQTGDFYFQFEDSFALSSPHRKTPARDVRDAGNPWDRMRFRRPNGGRLAFV